MTPAEYIKQALRTERTPHVIQRATTVDDRPTPQPDQFELDQQLARLLHASLGMTTETAEFADALKKHLIYDKPLDTTNLLEEIGDALWYMAIALDATGFTFEDAFERNINKLRTRYPQKFTSEHALNRNLDAERKALEGEPIG